MPPVIARLREALSRPLPGLPGQMGMAPVPWPGTERIFDPNLECRRAGVLVLLYPVKRATRRGGASHVTGEDLCLALTRRTDALDNHRGQISFPGGSLDDGETTRAAALREAWEELGIESGGLEVLGELSPLYIPPSGFCIYPAVAYAAQRPAFAPNSYEVAELLEVPLAHLLDPANATGGDLGNPRAECACALLRRRASQGLGRDRDGAVRAVGGDPGKRYYPGVPTRYSSKLTFVPVFSSKLSAITPNDPP